MNYEQTLTMYWARQEAQLYKKIESSHFSFSPEFSVMLKRIRARTFHDLELAGAFNPNLIAVNLTNNHVNPQWQNHAQRRKQSN